MRATQEGDSSKDGGPPRGGPGWQTVAPAFGSPLTDPPPRQGHTPEAKPAWISPIQLTGVLFVVQDSKSLRREHLYSLRLSIPPQGLGGAL